MHTAQCCSPQYVSADQLHVIVTLKNSLFSFSFPTGSAYKIRYLHPLDFDRPIIRDLPAIAREHTLAREPELGREPESAREPELFHEPEITAEAPEQLETNLIPEVLPVREEYPRPEPREKPPPPLKETETFGLLG